MTTATALLTFERPPRGYNGAEPLAFAHVPLPERNAAWKDALARVEGGDGRFAVNAFDFVYRVKARNADLFLVAEVDGAYTERVAALRPQIERLERLERHGEALDDDEVRRLYLGDGAAPGLRTIATRPSTRDELRLLAVLLTQGPAGSAELANALALPANVIPRLVRALGPALHDVKTAAGTSWDIRDKALAPVLFVLRAKMGLDPLERLP